MAYDFPSFLRIILPFFQQTPFVECSVYNTPEVKFKHSSNMTDDNKYKVRTNPHQTTNCT